MLYIFSSSACLSKPCVCPTSKEPEKKSSVSKATSTSNLHFNPVEFHQFPPHSLPPNFRHGPQGPVPTSESDVHIPVSETCQERHRSRFEPGEDRGYVDRDHRIGLSSLESGIDEGGGATAAYSGGNDDIDGGGIAHIPQDQGERDGCSSSTLTDATLLDNEMDRIETPRDDPTSRGGPAYQADNHEASRRIPRWQLAGVCIGV